MSLPIPTDPLALVHWHRAIADHVARHGRERVPPELIALGDALDAMLAQPNSSALASVADDLGFGHARLMSHSEVAASLGVSRSTVGRYVAEGKLDVIGARITAVSLERLVG